MVRDQTLDQSRAADTSAVRGFFVAGTDTGVGKTMVCCALLEAFRHHGLRCAGMKPVAAGGILTAQGLRNEDALALNAHASTAAEYSDVNPYALPDAVSPHIAAARAGVQIDLQQITAAYRRLAVGNDAVVVEGAGGWLAPLSPTSTMAAVAQQLQLPIVLVVGVRLGCLNHAQLTARAVLADGCTLRAWVGSVIEADMPALAENLHTLGQRLAVPCLGVIPRQRGTITPASLVQHLDLSALGI